MTLERGWVVGLEILFVALDDDPLIWKYMTAFASKMPSGSVQNEHHDGRRTSGLQLSQ